MTALCGGGTSSQKPGYDRLLSVAPWVIAGLITDVPPVTAAAIGGAIGNTLYDLNTFCVTDPPAMPTIGINDVIGLLNPQDQLAFQPAAAKFRDLVANYAWRAFCQCDGGTVPAAVSAPSAVLQYNPQPSTGTAITSGPCFDQTVYSIDVLRDLSPGASGSAGTIYPLTQRFSSTPGTAPRGFTGYTGTVPTYRLPAGAVSAHIRGHKYFVGGSRAFPLQYGLATWNAAGSNVGGIGTSNMTLTVGDYDSAPLNPGALGTGALDYAVYFEQGPSDPSLVADMELIFQCSSAAPAQVQPCCPPDASMVAVVNQILGYVQLLQRQTAPFAYVSGASHSVSGSGILSVQGLLGMKLTLDSYGSAVGMMSGDPAEFFEAGWFAWGNADGFTERTLITHSPQVSFPPVAGQYTHLGYTLGQGVSATIVELSREP